MCTSLLFCPEIILKICQILCLWAASSLWRFWFYVCHLNTMSFFRLFTKTPVQGTMPLSIFPYIFFIQRIFDFFPFMSNPEAHPLQIYDSPHLNPFHYSPVHYSGFLFTFVLTVIQTCNPDSPMSLPPVPHTSRCPPRLFAHSCPPELASRTGWLNLAHGQQLGGGGCVLPKAACPRGSPLSSSLSAATPRVFCSSRKPPISSLRWECSLPIGHSPELLDAFEWKPGSHITDLR